MHTLNRAPGLAVVGVLALVASLQAQSFDILFRVIGGKGTCQVKKPDATVFEPAIKGKAYPFGTTVRTGKDSEAFVLLSPDDALRMSPLCELTVSEPAGTVANSNRVVRLTEGKIDVNVRDGLPEKALTIETAVAACDGFVGRSYLELARVIKKSSKDRDQLDLALEIRTDNGALRVTGPQFCVPKLKPGSGLRIESSADRSITRIINQSNDYKVEIDQGTETPASLDTTSHSTVRICREQAPVGGKLVVSVLATAPDGKGKENFAYVLGEPSLYAYGLPSMTEDRGATGAVATATAPAAATNATPKVEESLFK